MKKKPSKVKRPPAQLQRLLPSRYLPLWGGYLILIVITLVIYAPVRTYDFVNFDDPFYVTDNPNIQKPLSIQSIWWAFSTGYFFNWHPITWLSYMTDFRLFALDAGKYHVVNLVFHVLNVLLLCEVLRRMTGALGLSAFVAALFAIHPLHVESVAWISERKDMVSTFFMLATLLAYWAYAKRPGWGRYLWVAGLYALGLMAKPMLVTLPFALLLLDYWPLRRLSFAESVGPSEEEGEKGKRGKGEEEGEKGKRGKEKERDRQEVMGAPSGIQNLKSKIQNPESRIPNPETRNPKPETRNPKPDSGLSSSRRFPCSRWRLRRV
jgi:hypothetical protein